MRFPARVETSLSSLKSLRLLTPSNGVAFQIFRGITNPGQQIIFSRCQAKVIEHKTISCSTDGPKFCTLIRGTKCCSNGSRLAGPSFELKCMSPNTARWTINSFWDMGNKSRYHPTLVGTWRGVPYWELHHQISPVSRLQLKRILTFHRCCSLSFATKCSLMSDTEDPPSEMKSEVSE